MTWLLDMVYGICEGVTGIAPDWCYDSFGDGTSLAEILRYAFDDTSNIMFLVLYFLFLGMFVIGLMALFRWAFTFVFKAFKMD